MAEKSVRAGLNNTTDAYVPMYTQIIHGGVDLWDDSTANSFSESHDLHKNHQAMKHTFHCLHIISIIYTARVLKAFKKGHLHVFVIPLLVALLDLRGKK